MSSSSALPPLASPTSKARRKPSTRRGRAASSVQHPREVHNSALQAIRQFLKSKNSYDVFPVSFRIIVLDTKLEVKKALGCLLANGVVSACLWNSEKSCFAGMLTVSDLIHLMQYYYQGSATYDDVTSKIEKFRLEKLREIEKDLGVDPPPLLSMHPMKSIWEAARMLIQTHARRLPLIDHDSATGHEVVVSVMTQYRMLKFIAINCKEADLLHMPLRKLGIGTYVHASPSAPLGPNRFAPLEVGYMDSTVFDIVHVFSERGISAVPILDADGRVLNLYETVDVISLVKSGDYRQLDLTIATALNMRSPDFPGVITCTAQDSLGTLLRLIRQRRVHRLIVVEGELEEKEGGKKGRLLGIITLADVLQYIVGDLGIGEGSESVLAEVPDRSDALLSPSASSLSASVAGSTSVEEQ